MEDIMKLPDICIINNKISDLTEDTALKLPTSMVELRKYVSMLVIDDNDFIPEEYWNIYVKLLDEKSKKQFEAIA